MTAEAQEIAAEMSTTPKQPKSKVVGDTVIREGLLAEIIENLALKLCFVCAPCGYGKTTLLEQLAARLKHQSDTPPIIVSLKPHHQDISLFVRAIIDQISADHPDPFLEKLSNALEKGDEGHQSVQVASDLFQWLSETRRGAYLLFDNYEQAQSADVNRVLTLLLKGDEYRLRTIIAATHGSVPQLTKLRLSERCLEIRADKLRFDEQEIDQFLSTAFEQNIPYLSEITELSEGWPIAIGLARLWIKEGCSPEEIVTRLGSGHRDIDHYLEEEFLSTLPAPTQKFLTKLSMLDVFNPEIAENVLGIKESAQHLSWLRGHDAFITPSPTIAGCYQHPRFLQQFLARKREEDLSPKEVAALHEKASEVFRSRKDYSIAFNHALASGNHETIAELLKYVGTDLFWLGADFDAFQGMAKRLPTDTQKYPDLTLCKAFYAIQAGEFSLAEKLLDQLNEQIDENGEAAVLNSALRRQFIILRSILYYYIDNDSDNADQAQFSGYLKNGEIESRMGRALLMRLIGYIHEQQAKLPEAQEWIFQAFTDFDIARAGYDAGASQDDLVRLALLDGDSVKAKEYLGTAHGVLPNASARASRTLAETHLQYETGQLDEVSTSLSPKLRHILGRHRIAWPQFYTLYYVAAMNANSSKDTNTPHLIIAEGLSIARQRQYRRLEVSLLTLSMHIYAINDDQENADRVREQLRKVGIGDNVDWQKTRDWLMNGFLAVSQIRYRIAFEEDYTKTLRLISDAMRALPAVGADWFQQKLLALRALNTVVGKYDNPGERVRAYLEAAAPKEMYASLLQEGPLAAQALKDTASSLRRTKLASPIAQTYIRYFSLMPDYVRNSYTPPKIEELSATRLKIMTEISAGRTRDDLCLILDLARSTIDSQLKSTYRAMNCGTNGKLLSIAMFRRYIAPHLPSEKWQREPASDTVLKGE